MTTPNGEKDLDYFRTLRSTDGQKTTRPGIIVFSFTMELLHINGRAMELIRQSEKWAPAILRCIHSSPVIEVCAKVQQALDSYLATGIWEPIEVSKIVRNSERSIMLRGIGLLDQNSIDRARIVIVLDEVGLEEKREPIRYKSKFAAIQARKRLQRSVRLARPQMRA